MEKSVEKRTDVGFGESPAHAGDNFRVFRFVCI